MGKRIDELLGIGTADELIQISKQTHKIDKIDLEIKYTQYLELSKKLNKFE